MLRRDFDGQSESDSSEPVRTPALSQSLGSKTRKSTSNQPTTDQAAPETPQSELPSAMGLSSLEIVVPTIDYQSDYEYLPGHFAVRRILEMKSDDPKKPSYTVRLQSGERETVFHSCIRALWS